MSQNTLDQRSESLLKEIRTALDRSGNSLTKEVRVPLMQLIAVVPYLDRLKQPELKLAMAEIAKSALLSQDTAHEKIELAKQIINELDRRKGIYENSVRSIWYGRSPIVHVFWGLSVFLVLLILSVALSRIFPTPSREGIEPVMIRWVLIAGALGGIVSILARIKDFAIVSQWDPESDPKVLFFTGLLKPLVGAVFAIFLYAVLNTNLLQLNPAFTGKDGGFWLYVALSFVAGFSERLVPDVISRIEKIIESKTEM